MSWPAGQEYLTAVQNPGLAFRDPGLRLGQAEEDRLGLPKPRSGTYAVAFKIQSGVRHYAVRCFLKDSPDRQARYQAISDYLKYSKLTYAVEFEYQRDGILVNGTWYPMLKMEWVDGSSLGTYVAKNIGNPRILIDLARRLVEMAKALKQLGIAHGDLQHGNVLVLPGGDIKLIDYDGMFVPALRGRQSEELGQRNYQHPLRSAADFGPSLDHFSLWVIYASLVICSVDPSVWARAKAGDECLLFRKSDFEDPERSATFQLIEHSKDGGVRSLGRVLRAFLYCGVSQVPPLDESSTPHNPAGPVVVPTATAPASPRGSDWLSDHKTAHPPGPRVSQVEADGAPLFADGAGWVLDYLKPSRPALRFSGSFWTERAIVVLVVAVTIAGFYLFRWQSIAVALPLAIAGGIISYVRYSGLEVVSDARRSSSAVRVARTQVAGASRSVADIGKKRARVRSALESTLGQIEVDKNRLERAERAELDEVAQHLRLTIASILAKRQALHDREAEGLKKLNQDIGDQILRAQRQLSLVDGNLNDSLAGELAAYQQQDSLRVLQSASLDRAVIPGIGPGLRKVLRAAGLHTAADVKRRGARGIPNIGPSRQSDLMHWVGSVEAVALRQRPASLPMASEQAIRSRYSTERSILENSLRNLRGQMAAEQQRLTNSLLAERETLAGQENEAQMRSNANEVSIQRRYEAQHTPLNTAIAEAHAVHDADSSKLDAELVALQSQSSRMKWHLARLEHEHDRYRFVNFRGFVQRVLWPLSG